MVTADNTPVLLQNLINSKMYDDEGDSNVLTNTATGSLTATWRDKYNNIVFDMTAIPSLCLAPYTLTITATASAISTQYGDPRVTTFSSSPISHSYTINPSNANPTICYARPDMTHATGTYAGPVSMWDPTKGFKVQSDSNYSLNFPTTGAHKVFFYLDVAGVDATTLTWPTVTDGVVSANMSVVNSSTVKVTLTGPHRTNRVAFNPLQIVLEGKSGSSTVVKYGFELKSWFINNVSNYNDFLNSSNWCQNINGSHYRIASASELTNGVYGGGSRFYVRKINEGFFTEWGYMITYGNGFVLNRYYWTDSLRGSDRVIVNPSNGGHIYTAGSYTSATRIYTVCISN